jgi:6-pyruvoyltetrahydropterin/6-carboxytetrahydropterin synthase
MEIEDVVEVYTVSKEIELDAGHRVPNHKSKCRNPHGHRYRLRVTITGELVTAGGASDEGMLADFGDLKGIMTEKVHDVLDHGFIVHEGDQVMAAAFKAMAEPWAGERPKLIVVPFIPTAENLAKWCWDQLEADVRTMGFELQLIELWETPTSLATYARYN